MIGCKRGSELFCASVTSGLLRSDTERYGCRCTRRFSKFFIRFLYVFLERIKICKATLCGLLKALQESNRGERLDGTKVDVVYCVVHCSVCTVLLLSSF